MRNEKEFLIDNLIKNGYLKTPLIIEAFKNIDRADFVPENIKNEAYLDEALPIGFGQTISQPLTVAFMLELLQPQPAEKILDIGSGSGWKAALLAYIVSEQSGNPKSEIRNPKQIQNPKSKIQNGIIVSIERIPELKEMAEKNIAKYNFIERGIVKVLLADGSRGAPPELVPAEGFDKIIAGAAAENKIPEVWKEQLKVGGRIIAPVARSILVLNKIDAKKFVTKEYFGFSFVPLVSE